MLLMQEGAKSKSAQITHGGEVEGDMWMAIMLELRKTRRRTKMTRNDR